MGEASFQTHVRGLLFIWAAHLQRTTHSLPKPPVQPTMGENGTRYILSDLSRNVPEMAVMIDARIVWNRNTRIALPDGLKVGASICLCKATPSLRVYRFFRPTGLLISLACPCAPHSDALLPPSCHPGRFRQHE